MTDSELHPVTMIATPKGAPPIVTVGQKVWYIPDEAHRLDVDHRGELLFVFAHTRNYGSPRLSYKAGERVTNFGMLGRGKLRRTGDGEFQTPGGHHIRMVGPDVEKPWPAVVREVFADGSVALDVAHPISGSLIDGHASFDRGVFITLHYPSHGATSGLRYSKTFEPHTWHLLEDRKAV